MSGFFVYVDWTTEDVPRPFYVGKGNERRIKFPRRNRLHENIANKHGLIRQVVFETDDEQLALALEQRLIAEYKTYVHGGEGYWGANFTLGGEGVSGLKFSEATRARLSQKARRENLSSSTRLKMSLSQRAKQPASIQTRMKMSKARKGKPFLSDIAFERKCKNQRKPVAQLLNGDIVATFSSVKEAYEVTKIFNIGMCCRGVRKIAGGFNWKFINEESA